MVLGLLEQAGIVLTSRRAATIPEIEQALAVEWDVIICDLATLTIDCRDILRMMDERGCKAPVIALAQEVDEAMIQGVLALGASDCLSKTDLGKLTTVIRREVRHAAELRAQQLAMSESEIRFSLFMDNLPGPANIKQEDGTFVYVNKAACELMGGTRDQLVGRKYTEVSRVSEETAKAVEDAERRMISSGRAFEKEMEYEFDGRKVTYLTVKFPIPRVGQPTLIGTVLLDITERRQTERQIEHLASFPELNPDPVLEVDFSGAVTYCNPVAKKLLNQSKLDDVREFFPADLHELLTILGPDRPGPVMREVTVKDRAIEESIRFVAGLNRVRIYGRDITLRKQGEASLRKLYRALKMLSECNQTLVQAGEEQHLLEDICRLVVEAGGYRMAWVGYAVHDAERQIRPVAQCGFEEGYLESAHITWEDAERGRGPTGTAVRTGVTQINQNFLTNPSMAPWRELAQQRGFQSSIALPLIKDHSTFGVLTIYSAQPDAFDAEETALLTELAEDLAFGITALRERIDLRRAEEQVRRANAYNRSLLEASLDPLVTIDIDGRIMDVNKATEAVTGHPREKLIGSDFCDYFTDPQKARDGYRQVFEKGSVNDYPLEIRHRDGRITPVLYNATVYRDEKGEVAGVFAAARDIREIKRAEEQVRRANAYNRSLIEASLDPLVTIGADGRIMDVNKATEAVTGHPREKLIGSDFCDYFTDPQKARDGYRQVFEKGSVNDYPLEIQHRDGRVTPVLYNATVYHDEKGEVAGVFAAARDITERKEAESKLEDALRQLKTDSEQLERKNIALAEVLNQIEREKTVLKMSISANLELSIIPALMRLEAKGSPQTRKQLARIRQDLNDATSPFLVGLKSEFDNLSPRELEICRMIKAGMSSKEIAENLRLSLLTVQKFRELIRKKLNLTNKDINLGTFLQSRTRTLL